MRNTSTWSGTCTASFAFLDLIYNFKMSILEQVQFSNRARLKMDLENGETAPLQAAPCALFHVPSAGLSDAADATTGAISLTINFEPWRSSC